jgi:hypothetical protein
MHARAPCLLSRVRLFFSAFATMLNLR